MRDAPSQRVSWKPLCRWESRSWASADQAGRDARVPGGVHQRINGTMGFHETSDRVDHMPRENPACPPRRPRSQPQSPNRYNPVMKSAVVASTTLLLLSCPMLPAGAQKSPEKQSPWTAGPPRTFASVDALKRWGQSSAFGGGIVSEPFKLGPHTVYVVNRTHTSGVLTAELSVYAVDRDGKGVTQALFQPTRMASLSTRLVDGAIVCEARDPQTGKKVPTLTITRHLFDSMPWPSR